MPDSEAEVCVVLKDGKVVGRWIGRDAELILSMIVNVHHYGASDEEDLRRCDPRPTVTRPLRRVTEVVGWVDNDFRGTICLERTGPGEVNAVQIDCVVPDECCAKGDDEPKTYRFRFTVEAVEEKGR